jgi:hypothetical protein
MQGGKPAPFGGDFTPKNDRFVPFDGKKARQTAIPYPILSQRSASFSLITHLLRLFLT